MKIELFWIILTVFLYVVLTIYLYVSRKKIGSLKASLIDAKHKKAEIGNFLSLFPKTLKPLKK
jgi:hypothetical protein